MCALVRESHGAACLAILAVCGYPALRQLRQIRRYVPTSTFQKLVVALVHSRLDYGNGVLVGIPAHLGLMR